MNDGAYRTTFEDIMGKYATRKGVVVDTRFNGGGDLVADLAMFLSGKKFFDYTTDTRSTGYEPNFRWTKPTVAMANEANYSDGHCFAYAYKTQKLGPLVGMPTPGTCTFAGWETLQDGIRWGVPGVGVKDATTGKYLENSQTEPDIKVMNQYKIVEQGPRSAARGGDRRADEVDPEFFGDTVRAKTRKAKALTAEGAERERAAEETARALLWFLCGPLRLRVLCGRAVDLTRSSIRR